MDIVVKLQGQWFDLNRMRAEIRGPKGPLIPSGSRRVLVRDWGGQKVKIDLARLGGPIELACARHKLVEAPSRSAVGRVDRDRGIITPAARAAASELEGRGSRDAECPVWRGGVVVQSIHLNHRSIARRGDRRNSSRCIDEAGSTLQA